MRLPIRPIAALVLLVACTSISTPPPGADEQPIGYVEITPKALILTHAGATSVVSANVFDAEGRPTTQEVTWRSLDESAATVTADGVVTATTDVGSTQVVAEVDGAQAAVALVFIADPADGAQLLVDAQVLTLPEPLDPTATPGVGFEYSVRLDLAEVPAVGTVLINTGELPVGGRVVNATSTSAGVEVVMEIIALDDMFDQLRIEETIDLANAPIMFEDDVLDMYDIDRLPGGSVRFTPKSGVTLEFRTTRDLRPQADPSFEFTVGPIECKGTGTLPSIGMSPPVITIGNNLTLDYAFGTGIAGVQKAVVEGSIDGELSFRYGINSAFEAKLECTFEAGELYVATGAMPLWFVFPYGLGFELGGKITFANMGFEFKQAAHINGIKLGFECPVSNDCDFHAEGNFDVDEPDVTFDFPASLGSDFRFEPSLFGFLYVNGGIGVPLFFDLEVVGAKAGLKQEANLAPMKTQAEDTTYASSFGLKLTGSLTPGEDLQTFFTYLGLSNFNRAELKIETSWGTSPTGTFTIRDEDNETPPSVIPGNEEIVGELAEFIVELDPSTVNYPQLPFGISGPYNVEDVQFRWKKPDSTGGFTLENGRPNCNIIEANADGQTDFSCATDFLEEHAGEQTFYAFVNATVFGIPLPVPLEITPAGAATKDGQAKITVGASLVLEADFPSTIEPGSATPLVVRAGYPDETGTIVYEDGIELTLSATGGTVSPTTGITNLNGELTANATLGQGEDTIVILINAVDPATGAVASTSVSAGIAAGVRVLSNRAHARAVADVNADGTTRDDQLISETDFETFDAAVSASAEGTHYLGGMLTAAASSTHHVALSLDSSSGLLTSLTASGHVTANATSEDGGNNRSEGHAYATGRLEFEVVGEPVSFNLTFTVEEEVASGNVFFSVEMTDLDDAVTIFRHFGSGSETGTLDPGNYRFDFSLRASCNTCGAQNQGTSEAQLNFQSAQ